jgi:protein-disulfide isomerase
LSQQGTWVSQDVRVPEIAKVAAQVGITGAQFTSCLENRDMVTKLNWVKERGRKLGVIGTPNFFINGKLVKSVIGMNEIRAYVAAAESGQLALPAQSAVKAN